MLTSFGKIHVFWAILFVLSYFTVKFGRHYWRLRKLKQQHGCKPVNKYPHKDLLGNDMVYETAAAMASGKFIEYRQSKYIQLGKTYQGHLWTEKKLFTIDTKNIQSIYALNFESYGVEPIRAPSTGMWLGRGIFTTDGASWHHARGLIKPIFSRAQISDLPSFAKWVDKLLKLIPEDGEEIDIQPLFVRMYLDQSTEALFGESTKTLVPDESERKIDADKFLKAFDACLKGAGRKFQQGKWLRMFMPEDAEFKAGCEELKAFVDQCIDEAIARRQHDKAATNKFIFVDDLLNQTFDRVYIRDQMLNVFFPARETSSGSINLIFFQLARHPEVWAKLRTEALANGDRPLTFESLKSMTYTQNTIKEALRLLSPAGGAQRVCIQDNILPHGGGPTGDAPILVTKGTIVRTDWDLMHRDPDIWGDDAEKFRPERWEEGIKPQWEFIPFMGGPRICPAQQWILTQIAYILVRFAGTFERMENRDPVLELIEAGRQTKKSSRGVKVAFYQAVK